MPFYSHPRAPETLEASIAFLNSHRRHWRVVGRVLSCTVTSWQVSHQSTDILFHLLSGWHVVHAIGADETVILGALYDVSGVASATAAVVVVTSAVANCGLSVVFEYCGAVW